MLSGVEQIGLESRYYSLKKKKKEEENQITRWDLRQCRSMDLWIKKSTPDINISAWERNCLEKQMKNLRGLLQFFLMFDIVKCFFFTPFSSL